MRGAAAVVLVWALMLGALALVLAVWSTDALARGLLFGAAAATLLVAVVALVAGREPAARTVPDVSVSTAVFALGLAAFVLGGVFGTWLVLLGLGLAVVGLAALGRELVSARRRP